MDSTKLIPKERHVFMLMTVRNGGDGLKLTTILHLVCGLFVSKRIVVNAEFYMLKQLRKRSALAG